MASAPHVLRIGPLHSTIEVIVFVALSGMTWFNGTELLITVFFTFKQWTGKYFYFLIITTVGTMVYQTNVFLIVFGSKLDAYGNIASMGIGWSAMMTGQALVLWSRLHLVCRSRWKLHFILAMIIFNGLSMHGIQFTFSLLAIKNNAIDPTYKPFAIMAKISIAVLTAQEFIISVVYLVAAIDLLRTGAMLSRAGTRHRIKLLILTNLIIIALDICTITLEFLALWGIWCGFKGFAYSVKLKIEFAILSQLRDSVQGASEHDSSYVMAASQHSVERSRSRRGAISSVILGGQRRWSVVKRLTTAEPLPMARGQIEKVVEIDVRQHECGQQDMELEQISQSNHAQAPPSKSSSVVNFASRGL